MAESRIGDWAQTPSGRKFWPLDPRSEEIHIEDIAHNLASQCRFGGATRSHYSVAQHSVIVSYSVSPPNQPRALMHDSPEAYLFDLPRPIKHHSRLGVEYERIEENILVAVCARFDLPLLEPAEITVVDKYRIILAERRDVMGPVPDAWKEEGYEPLPDLIVPWTAEEAHYQFLARYFELFEERAKQTLPQKGRDFTMDRDPEIVEIVRRTRPEAFRFEEHALGIVARIDHVLQFAPKGVREALLDAREALRVAGQGHVQGVLDRLTTTEALRDRLLALEKLISCDTQQIAQLPKLYESDVRYLVGADGPLYDAAGIVRRGGADAESLVAWRCAELRMNGLAAKPFIKWYDRPDGNRIYTVVVLLPDGTSEDVVQRLHEKGV